MSIFASSLSLPADNLCSRDNRTVANASHSCSPGYSSRKSYSHWLNSLLLKIPEGWRPFLDVDQALTTVTKYGERVAGRKRVERGCSVLFSTKLMM